MNDLVTEFETHRPRLRAVAYRMLGSLTESEDAVQETWLRLARTDAGEIDNLGGWLTTVTGRICLDLIRARQRRHEEPLDAHLPDPVVTRAADPEQQAILADAVGLAMQVVLESLNPPERLAFVLHDVFGLPFEQIAPIVDRTPATAKKLASRARLRVREQAPTPDPDPADQRRAVRAFQSAARHGDLEALVALLDPDVVLRVDGGTATGGLQILRGARAVAGRATLFRRVTAGLVSHEVLVNGVAGLVNEVDGVPLSVMAFTVAGGTIVAIDLLIDAERLNGLDLPVTFTAPPPSYRT